MKLFNLIVSTCLSVFLFFVLQMIWGSAGIVACADLEEYKTRLQSNIEQLRDFEATMISDLARLEYDQARLRQEAYRIGLVGADETRVRLPIPSSETISAPGTVAAPPKEYGFNQALISGISISFGVVFLLFLTVINFEAELIKGIGRKKRQARYYQGTRVQTASLE